MGLILPQKVKVKWTGNTRKHYESKGYIYTKNLDEFDVNVEDLTNGSTVIVDVRCDFCESIKQMPYKDYLHLQSELYCCSNCLAHKRNTEIKTVNCVLWRFHIEIKSGYIMSIL